MMLYRAILLILSVVSLPVSSTKEKTLYTYLSMCPDYLIIKTTSAWRESSETREGATSRCDATADYLDQGKQGSYWFRLEGDGGNGIINHIPHRTDICGTSYPGWIQGDLPRPFGIKGARLCYLNLSNGSTCEDNYPCSNSVEIDIFNCAGEFLLYRIPAIHEVTAGCAKAFCTGEVGPCELRNYTKVDTSNEMSINFRAPSTASRCDHQEDYVDGKTWIRLQGPGGTEITRTQPVEEGMCKTTHPGWIIGNAPSQLGVEVQNQLCYSMGSNGECQDSRRIDEMNCYSFMLYRLHPSSSGCSRAFCTHKPSYENCHPKSYSNETARGAWSPRFLRETIRVDDNWYAENKDWIRLQAEGGLKVITTSKPVKRTDFACGVRNPGWMDGEIPRKMDGIVQRRLCYNDGSNTVCPHARNVDVLNCGSFVLYRFQRAEPLANSGFCIELETPTPCHYKPCLHESICTNSGNCYKCQCPPGVTGQNCEKDGEDECDSQPCQNGRTCYDEIGKYTCACKANYEGRNCETDKNPCSSNPCQNGGTCVKNENGYECQCAVGFTGSNCETRVVYEDDRQSQPCKNGGICEDGVNKFTCKCIFYWTGSTCEDSSEIVPYIDGIRKYYDGDDDDDDDCGGFFGFFKCLFSSVGSALASLFATIAGALANFFPSLPNLNNKLNNNPKQNPGRNCAFRNLGSMKKGLEKGDKMCKRKYDNKKCSVREKAKPKEKETSETKRTDPPSQTTPNPAEKTTTERPFSCTSSCSAIRNPEHGAYIGDKTNCGDSVAFNCETGFELSGCSNLDCKITCQSDGQWSAQPPKCIRKACGGLITLSDSQTKKTIELAASSKYTKCNWVISTGQPGTVEVKFETFILPNSVFEENTCVDYVAFVHGTKTTRYCGGIPEERIEIYNEGLIRFKASSSSQYHIKMKLSYIPGCNSLSSTFYRRTFAPACNQDCMIKSWPPNPPVILSGTDLQLPDHKGNLKIKHSAQVDAYCSNSFIKYSLSPIDIECDNGKLKILIGSTTENNANMRTLDCSTEEKPDLEINGNKINIGWALKQVTQITVTFDKIKRIPDHAIHTLYGASLGAETKLPSGTRGDFKKTDLPGVNEVSKNFSMNEQQRRFNLNGLGLATYVDCCNSHYLVRGHLAPYADFVMYKWREATMYMANIAPQWQGIYIHT